LHKGIAARAPDYVDMTYSILYVQNTSQEFKTEHVIRTLFGTDRVFKKTIALDWYDEYTGEDVVLLAPVLAQERANLELYASTLFDRNKWTAATKGGRITMRPWLVVIVSTHEPNCMLTSSALNVVEGRMQAVYLHDLTGMTTLY
jgi:hypothetical protein